MSVIEQPAQTTTEVTVSDVLRRAADLLEEFGWCQGVAAIRDDGVRIGIPEIEASGTNGLIAFCRNGAIVKARMDLCGMDLCGSLDLFDSGMLGTFSWSEVSFNDAPGTTKEMVVARLRSQAEAYQAYAHLA